MRIPVFSRGLKVNIYLLVLLFGMILLGQSGWSAPRCEELFRISNESSLSPLQSALAKGNDLITQVRGTPFSRIQKKALKQAEEYVEAVLRDNSEGSKLSALTDRLMQDRRYFALLKLVESSELTAEEKLKLKDQVALKIVSMIPRFSKWTSKWPLILGWVKSFAGPQSVDALIQVLNDKDKIDPSLTYDVESALIQISLRDPGPLKPELKEFLLNMNRQHLIEGHISERNLQQYSSEPGVKRLNQLRLELRYKEFRSLANFYLKEFAEKGSLEFFESYLQNELSLSGRQGYSHVMEIAQLRNREESNTEVFENPFVGTMIQLLEYKVVPAVSYWNIHQGQSGPLLREPSSLLFVALLKGIEEGRLKLESEDQQVLESKLAQYINLEIYSYLYPLDPSLSLWTSIQHIHRGGSALQ